MRTICQFKIPPPQLDNQVSDPSAQNSQTEFNSEDFDIIEGEYIVIFKNQFDSVFSDQVARKVDQVRQEVQSRHQIKDEAILGQWQRTTKGFAAKLDSNQVQKLKNDPQVARVKPNFYYRITSDELDDSKMETKELKMDFGTAQAAQTIPWGVERVRGPYDGTGKTAWIMDSGIDLDHPDLNVDVSRSISFITGEDANDLNGHGTLVAGVIAAIDNDIDVAGVAAGATVISVKVCQDAFPLPICPYSSVLSGIEYVSNNAQNQDIVNISLGGPTDSDVDNAVLTAAWSGIRFSIAAGNSQSDANNLSPARVNHFNIKTVSAFGEGDVFAADFSNFGNPPIDFSAPGVDIYSLWLNGGTNTGNGTSFATPHVAGIMLVNGPPDPDNLSDNPIPTDGTVTGDPDSNPDRIAVVPSDVSVFISGSSFVTNGQTGHWSANVSGGESPFSFEWLRNVYQPPLWQKVGTSSSYSQVVIQSFELKVRVTDASGTTVTSRVFNVSTN